jgi:hypothetical protein
VKIVIEGITERNCRSGRFDNEALFSEDRRFRSIGENNKSHMQVIKEIRPALYGLLPIVFRLLKRLRNDFIFLINGGIEKPYLFLKHKMSEGSLEATIQVIRERSTKIRRSGRAYVFVPIPAKQTIYGNDIDRYTKTYLSELVRRLKIDGVMTVDLAPEFLAQKSKVDLYFKYDTHWNAAGVDLAAKTILVELTNSGVLEFVEK